MLVINPPDTDKPASGHLLRDIQATETGIATRSDVVWKISVAGAEGMGCDYPGEPAGVSNRLLLQEGPMVTTLMVVRSIGDAVASCDACYGYCSVPPAMKQTLE